ncbi:hypothetical protein Tco_0658649 [Tanacetum coccineum]
MQDKLKLSKSQGASTPAKKQRLQNVPYASIVRSIMYAVRCELYWNTVKNILKYLRNTKDMFLVYGDVEYIAAFDASKEAVWIRKFISGLGVVPTIEEPINMYCDNTRAIAIAKDHGVTKGASRDHSRISSLSSRNHKKMKLLYILLVSYLKGDIVMATKGPLTPDTVEYVPYTKYDSCYKPPEVFPDRVKYLGSKMVAKEVVYVLKGGVLGAKIAAKRGPKGGGFGAEIASKRGGFWLMGLQWVGLVVEMGHEVSGFRCLNGAEMDGCAC